MERFFLCCLTFLAVTSCNYDFGAIEDEETQEDETQTQKATSSETVTNDDTQEDTGTASDSGSGTASDSGSGTASDSGSGSDSESDVDTSTEEPTVLYLHFWERIRQLNYYQGHELHLGPGSSTDPTKPGWKVLADEESMYNPAANDIWARSNPIEFTGKSGTTIRFAWRYTGMFADDWYIDDLCLSSKATLPAEADCHYWQDFDGVAAGAWPPGFSSAEGPNNTADSNWKTTIVVRHSSPNSASITYSYGSQTDQFLISPAITLP